MLYNLFENRDFVSVFAVALLAEGVDRNVCTDITSNPFQVALLAEGVDRNIQSEDTELTRLEITQRVRLKLQKREVILPESIEISIAFEDDAVVLHCSFRFAEEDERHELDVIIGAVSVEVISE